MTSFLGGVADRFGGSVYPHLLAPAVLLLAFTFPPVKYRALITTLLTCVLAYFCLTYPYGQERTSYRYAISGMWIYYAGILAKLVFHEPEKEFWRIDREAKEAERMGFGWQKLRWALSLFCAARGVGWNFQIGQIPKTKFVGKRRFLIKTAIQFLVYYFLLDLATQFLVHAHFYDANQRIKDLGLLYSMAIECLMAVQSYCATNMQYAAVSFPSTLLRLTGEKVINPKDGAGRSK